MESRVSYAAVGLFVLVLTTALIGLGLWLGSDVTMQRYDRYSIYFTESVAGLYMNAPVKYHGVVVGRVEVIELAAQDPERVHVVAAITEGTPVKIDTRATLDPQGVTGVVHIELTGGTREAPLLARDDGAPYPVIQSTPSLFSRLDEALTEGLQTLEGMAAQLATVLSAENQQNLARTLANLASFSETMAANGGRIERTLANAERMSADGARLAADMRTTLERWSTLADQLAEVGVEVKGLAAAGQQEVAQVGRTTVPEVNALVGELRTLTENLSRLSDELRENPRMLIFGRPRGEPGPGE